MWGGGGEGCAGSEGRDVRRITCVKRVVTRALVRGLRCGDARVAARRKRSYERMCVAH